MTKLRYIALENTIDGTVIGHYIYDNEKGYEIGEIYTTHSLSLLQPILDALNKGIK